MAKTRVVLGPFGPHLAKLITAQGQWIKWLGRRELEQQLNKTKK